MVAPLPVPLSLAKVLSICVLGIHAQCGTSVSRGAGTESFCVPPKPEHSRLGHDSVRPCIKIVEPRKQSWVIGMCL